MACFNPTERKRSSGNKGKAGRAGSVIVHKNEENTSLLTYKMLHILWSYKCNPQVLCYIFSSCSVKINSLRTLFIKFWLS